MKYIVYRDGEREHLVTFPETIDHDRMAEAMERLRFGDRRNWHRNSGEIVGAGFVDDGECHGKSETLGVTSRHVDTAILRAGGVRSVPPQPAAPSAATTSELQKGGQHGE